MSRKKDKELTDEEYLIKVSRRSEARFYIEEKYCPEDDPRFDEENIDIYHHWK